MRHVIFILFYPNEQRGGGCAARLFILLVFPVQQTTIRIGHRVKSFFRVGNKYAECENSLHRHPSDLRRNVTKWVVIQDYRVFCLCIVSCPYMVINVSVQDNGGSLPDIFLLTQVPIFVWFDGNIILLLPS